MAQPQRGTLQNKLHGDTTAEVIASNHKIQTVKGLQGQAAERSISHPSKSEVSGNQIILLQANSKFSLQFNENSVYVTGGKAAEGNNMQIGLIQNYGKTSLFSRMSPNNSFRSPMVNKYGAGNSGDAMGTLRTQASTGIISAAAQGNANSSSTFAGGVGHKTVGNTMKAQRGSTMTSPFKDALQKGVVSGVGMLTF